MRWDEFKTNHEVREIAQSHTYQMSSTENVEILQPRIENGQEKTTKGCVVLETEMAKKKRKIENNPEKNIPV